MFFDVIMKTFTYSQQGHEPDLYHSRVYGGGSVQSTQNRALPLVQPYLIFRLYREKVSKSLMTFQDRGFPLAHRPK